MGYSGNRYIPTNVTAPTRTIKIGLGTKYGKIMRIIPPMRRPVLVDFFPYANATIPIRLNATPRINVIMSSN
jgi:hypothetical protein